MSWKRIGAYEKRQEIGRGTYGTVYLGVHATTRARVAVKKVLGRTATAGAHEAALLKRCQGAAHVVQVSILGCYPSASKKRSSVNVDLSRGQ